MLTSAQIVQFKNFGYAVVPEFTSLPFCESVIALARSDLKKTNYSHWVWSRYALPRRALIAHVRSKWYRKKIVERDTAQRKINELGNKWILKRNYELQKEGGGL